MRKLQIGGVTMPKTVEAVNGELEAEIWAGLLEEMATRIDAGDEIDRAKLSHVLKQLSSVFHRSIVAKVTLS